MRIRRPLAALVTALALFGGSATLTACGDPSGADRSDGTTDDTDDEFTGDTDQENTEDGGNLPNNSDPEPGQNSDDDRQDPD